MKTILLLLMLIGVAISVQAEPRKFYGSDSVVVFGVDDFDYKVEGLYITNNHAHHFTGFLDIYYDKQVAYICHIHFILPYNEESFSDTGENGVCWLLEQQSIEGSNRVALTLYLKSGEKKILLEDPK